MNDIDITGLVPPSLHQDPLLGRDRKLDREMRQSKNRKMGGLWIDTVILLYNVSTISIV